MAAGAFGTEKTCAMLASAYIQFACDTKGGFHAVGASLAGSEEQAAAFQEIMDNRFRIFVAVQELQV